MSFNSSNNNHKSNYKNNRSEGSKRYKGFDRSDRSERNTDRSEHNERYERPARSSSYERSERNGGYERAERTEHKRSYERPNRFERSEDSSSNGYQRSERSERPRYERSEDGGFPRRDRSSRSEYSSSKPYASRNNGGSRAGSGYGNRSKRPIKKFNPSMFIKRVEEQTASPAFIPVHTFDDFAISAQLKNNIKIKGYVNPTPVQDQAIPAILQGRDIIATANTGTGKTAAFLIPLIHRVMMKETHRVLIITPTRELAAQIQDEFMSLKNNFPIKSALCIGAMSISSQAYTLKKNPAFVIGTPGRLKDLENNGYLDLSTFSTIVLDEVDTMLDIKFITDIKDILSKMPSVRHSIFFSATISPDIQRIIDNYLTNPVAVSVKTRQSAENVNQDVIMVNQQRKIDILHDLLNKPEFTKVIVFARTKRSTEDLASELRDRGFEVMSIHGNKTQAQRKKSLSLFKANHAQVLLATDVVARGIDIDNVSHVINFDLPQTYEDYIHRIGRTGRANKIGQALTFID